MTPLPSGFLIYMFTDIEGSTALWERVPKVMRGALARHDAIVRECVTAADGQIFKNAGDGFAAVFVSARSGVEAALRLQRAIHLESWPEEIGELRIRISLHAGAAELRDGDYYGPALNRTARLLAAGHGGQILLSNAVREQLGDDLAGPTALRDMGEHRLRDLLLPEKVFQLLHPNLPSDFPPLRSLQSPQMRNNLPQQLTSFIGREREMEELKTLLRRVHLLTLTGSGGAGKTRLALQTAADLLDHYADGVWLVELAALRDPELLPQTVATALGVPEIVGKPVHQTLLDHLQKKYLLLIVDNCEHLVDAAAGLSDSLLRNCPNVTILASSREALGITGEQTYRVPSLSLPDSRSAARQTACSVVGHEAAQLLIERVSAVQPSFIVTDANAPALAQLCVRLDGIPLAIELAAARARALSIQEINHRLDNRFRLLTGGSRTALPRQQTLRALIDWSYDLLTPPEKTLLCRLAVFSGGWTLEAAEAVCAGGEVEEWEVLDLLTGLADKSLVLADSLGSARTRYRLLETVRQYARDRLAEREEVSALRSRHQRYFCQFAVEAEPLLRGVEQAVYLDRLETEHDNLRAALDWRDGDDAESTTLRVVACLTRFWEVRGHITEGRERLAAALADHAPNGTNLFQIRALNAASLLASIQGDNQTAVAQANEALNRGRELDHLPSIAKSLQLLGTAAAYRGDLDEGRLRYDEAIALHRRLAERAELAIDLNSLGTVALHRGDYATARALYEETLSMRHEITDQVVVANAVNNLGALAYSEGENERAGVLFEETLAMQRMLGNRAGIAFALYNLGNVAFGRTDYAGANQYYAEALTIREELGDRGGMASALLNLGSVANDEHDYVAAESYYAAAVAIVRELGNRRLLAYALNCSGNIGVNTGNYADGLRHYIEALAIVWEIEAWPTFIESVDSFAGLAVEQDQFARATRLMGAADTLRSAHGLIVGTTGVRHHEERIARSRAALGNTAFEGEWAIGQALTAEETRALMLSGD